MNPSRPLSPEFHLLLACALHPLSQDEIDRLQLAASQPIDWPAFEALAERHGLVSVVYRNLSRYAASSLPQATLSNLKNEAERNRQHAFALLSELRDITSWLEQAKIRACVLKGPLLAQQLLGDIGLRTSKDIDLLLPLEHIAEAEAILLAHGYQRVQPGIVLSARQWRIYQREWYHFSFAHPQRKIYLELHWNIALHNLVPAQFARTLLARAEILPGTSILTISPDFLPVYLLIHGGKHDWARLKWLVDFINWMRVTEAPDWEQIYVTLLELGLQKILFQGILLAHDLFSVPIPESLRPHLDREPATVKLTRHSLAAIQASQYFGEKVGGFQNLKNILFQVRLKNDWRYRWSVLTKLWVTPDDWQQLPLPDALFPLYGLLRPFLWLWRYYINPNKKDNAKN